MTKVIVVGAGFGGITAAVECKNRGMEVTLIEKYINTKQYGDIIDFFNNGGSVISRWGDGKVARELVANGVNKAKYFQIHSAEGKLLFNDPFHHKPEYYYRQYSGHRGKLQDICLSYAKEIGVNCIIGKAVVKYNDGVGSASVTLDDGETLEADVVVAADGPKSIVLNQLFGIPTDENINSGSAVYRSYYNVTDEMRVNPLLKDFIRTEEDTVKVWYGKGVDVFAYCWNHGTDIAWVVTHNDTYEIKDKWSFPSTNDEVLDWMKGFDEKAIEIVKTTPAGRIIDYKLPWRVTLKNWVSENGHIIVIGDACHCHTPYSGQGGAQAIEDAYVLAECISKTPSDIPLALKATERIRYNRANNIHYSCITFRDMMHHTDFAKLDTSNQVAFVADWVMEHDICDDITNFYDGVVADIKSKKEGTIEELSPFCPGKFVSVLETAA